MAAFSSVIGDIEMGQSSFLTIAASIIVFTMCAGSLGIGEHFSGSFLREFCKSLKAILSICAPKFID